MTPQTTKLLIASDQHEDLKSIVHSLVREGYNVLFTNSNGILDSTKKHQPFIIILYIKNPEKNLGGICRAIKQQYESTQVMLIILSPINKEEVIIESLESADLYINTPVSSRLLLSKIKAATRRFNEEIKNTSIIGDITVNREKYVVLHKNIPVDFSRKEFELIALLTSKAGKVFLRNEILNLLWDTEVGTRTLDVHIHKIRQKLGDDSIKTIKGIGYKI